MASEIRDFREAHGLTEAEMAVAMSEALGREIKESTVRQYEKSYKIPKSWRRVLEPELGPDASTGGAGMREGEPPRAPAGEPNLSSTPGQAPQAGPSAEYGAVRERIAKAYSAIGAGASMLTHNDGYAAVADTYSHDLAAAWEAAARENANVKRIVDFMESGGPVGELVVAHLILVGGFVYVSGRGQALGFLYRGKFQGHHDAAAAALETARIEQEEAGFNGSAPFDPAGFVGQPEG